MNGAPRVAAGAPLPLPDHILRYIAKKHVDPKTHEISGKGFLPRPGEVRASANWLEHFDGTLENQIEEVRRHRRLTYEKRAKLVRLNVGTTLAHLADKAPGASITYDPLEPDPPKHPLPDHSHSLFHGLPENDAEDPVAAIVGELLLECIVGPVINAID